MSRWFRVYNDLIDERKVQKLPAEHFRVLINLWCIASKNEGTLPDTADIAYKLRMSEDETETIIDDFISRALLDNEGGRLVPHNWKSRQYKSDLSTERVKKHRAKQRREKKGNTNETE